MKTCPTCHQDFEPRYSCQRFCTRSCGNKYAMKQKRRGYIGTHARGKILVRQPGQAFWDHWTRKDYELYKKELPKEAEVKFL